MSAQRTTGTAGGSLGERATEIVAAMYDQAGDAYTEYADGDVTHLFAFDNLHAYADRRLWDVLDAKLVSNRIAGADSVSILDAGCGPGTWLRRLVTRAYKLGYPKITARGFDVSQAQIERARLLARDVCSLPGVALTFDVADIGSRLPEADASVDIAVCLYSVLSHVPVSRFDAIFAEIARVTLGHFIVTVRPIGSTPTIFVDSIDRARRFNLDHKRNECEVELHDGRYISTSFHLFNVRELTAFFEAHFDIEDLQGLDLFHGRFAPDSRWNPESLRADAEFQAELARLEETYARKRCFVERADHLLFVGRRRQPSMPHTRYGRMA